VTRGRQKARVDVDDRPTRATRVDDAGRPNDRATRDAFDHRPIDRPRSSSLARARVTSILRGRRRRDIIIIICSVDDDEP